jgi:multidrug efflux pump subunit AcrB
MKTDFNLSAWAVGHQSMVLFMILATLAVGVLSYTQLGRSEDPSFNVPVMTAVVVWPGATAQEIQDQVTNRMEHTLRELNGFDYVQTFSRQGYGAVSLHMKGGLPNQQLTDAWYQVRKKISDARSEFPEGVRGPYFNDEYNDVYMSLYAIAGDGLTMAELNEYAEKIKLDLQSVPSLAKVDILGKQPEKVYVELSSKRLSALGMTPRQVMDALGQQNLMSPSGSVDTHYDRVLVRVDGALHSAFDVAKVSIEAGGRLVRLSDIATVRAGFEDPPTYTIRHNGHPVLVIATTMMSNANILKVGEAVDERMAAIQASLPIGVTVEKYADQPKVVEESIWEFERSFLEALAIVLLVSFLSLGRRAGVIVATSVPLVLGIVLVVMYLSGWNLDRISLGSLIIALGLLVDDAIIAVEMMVLKIEQGWKRKKAATFAYTSTAFPMLTGTMVTVAGFMPVGFAKSIASEYAGGIFWIVGTALVTSWFVAVIFTPYLGMHLLPANMAVGTHANPYDKPAYHRLRKWVDLCVEHRKIVLAGTVVLFLLAIAGMTRVQQQFFPTASRPELMVELRMPEGAAFEATREQARLFEKVLAQDPDVEHYTVYTGAGAPRFYLSLEPELPNPGFAQFVIMTSGIEAREALRTRLLDYFTKDEAQPLVRGRVSRLEFGPPVGFPVQFRVLGPDPNTVRGIAYRVRDIVQESALVRDTQLNWNERVRMLRVRVDQDKARLLGLSSSDVSETMQTVLSGSTVTQIRRGEDLIDVVVRADVVERKTLQNLGDINVFSRTGAVIPLSQIARVEPAFEEPVLWRWNRNMAITVRSDLADGVQGPYATEKIWPSLQPVLDSLPAGYRIEKGGAIEEAEKSNRALIAVFPAMLLVILAFLMMQLQSFSRMLMVILTAPLGLIGIVPALLIFNAPFGFVAVLGVIALGGMIMRNSVILADQIERDIDSGAPAWQAIVDATVRRARPVVLTAAAAVLAMIPLTRSVFWGPMAISIMGGLIVATILTLGFVPALYAAWFKVQRA